MTDPLIHLHLPKNAGTTLSRMLKLGFLLRPPTNLLHRLDTLGHYNAVPWQRKVERIVALPPARRKRVRFFEAHCGWGVHEPLGVGPRYYTMLREPVDRALSVYFYLRRNGDLPTDTTLEQFISRPPPEPVWAVDNAQVRFLCGREGVIDDRPIGSCTPDMLDVACERLGGFFAVGLMERFDESAAILLDRLGWRLAWSIRSNVTGARRAASDIPDAIRARIIELNSLDTALHKFATELFARQVAGASPGFAARAARFGRRSALAGSTLGPALEWATNTKRRIRRRRRARAVSGGAGA